MRHDRTRKCGPWAGKDWAWCYKCLTSECVPRRLNIGKAHMLINKLYQWAHEQSSLSYLVYLIRMCICSQSILLILTKANTSLYTRHIVYIMTAHNYSQWENCSERNQHILIPGPQIPAVLCDILCISSRCRSVCVCDVQSLSALKSFPAKWNGPLMIFGHKLYLVVSDFWHWVSTECVPLFHGWKYNVWPYA